MLSQFRHHCARFRPRTPLNLFGHVGAIVMMRIWLSMASFNVQHVPKMAEQVCRIALNNYMIFGYALSISSSLCQISSPDTAESVWTCWCHSNDENMAQYGII